jgi:hypothetical protein
MKIREILEDTQRPTLNDAFRRWFGNSKVVDTNGNPLVVYHGTNQTIEKFAPERLGANTGSISSRAFFFTDHPGEAGEYAAMSARKQVSNATERERNCERLLKAIDRANDRGDFDLVEKLTLELEASEEEAMSGDERGANIVPVYLSVQKPLIIDMKSSVDLHQISAAIDHAKEQGYDGIRLDNVFEALAERPELFDTTQWIVFKPTQIKSIFNRGTWNGRSAKISEAKSYTIL